MVKHKEVCKTRCIHWARFRWGNHNDRPNEKLSIARVVWWSRGCINTCLHAHKSISAPAAEKIVSKLKNHSKNAGLVLNEEKTKILQIGKKQLVVEKFLGPHINNFLNGKNELFEMKKNLLSAVNAIRASNSLSYTKKLFIAREKIFSTLTHLVFVFSYCCFLCCLLFGSLCACCVCVCAVSYSLGVL